jgi:outer membrane cobalamin receptor
MRNALFCAVFLATQLGAAHAEPAGEPVSASSVVPTPAATSDTQAVPAPPKADKYVGMSLEALLNKEVVTSGRVKQKLSKSHSSITVITADDIRRLPATDLDGLLRLVVPGLDMRLQYDTQIKTYFGARGLTGIAYAKRFLFLLDGRPLNYPVDGDFDIDFRFPLSGVRQIEIIRGPGSSLYGANAFLGVINIITGPPEGAQDGWSAEARYGQYGINRASATATGKVLDDVNVFVSMEHKGADELGISRKFFNLPSTVTDYREGYGARDVKVSIEYKGLTLRGGLFSDDIATSAQGKYASDPANPNSYTLSRAEKIRFGSLAYDRSVSSVLSVGLQAYASESQKDDIYAPPQGALRPFVTPAGILKDFEVVELMKGVGGQVAYTPAEAVRLLAGGDFVRKESDTKFDRPTLNGLDSQQGAVFVEGNYEPFPWLDLVAGGRLDWHSEYDSQFSPRLSAMGKFLGDKGSLRLSYGNAFRAPTFAEIFPTKAVYPDVVVNPEKIRSLELAASYQARDVKVTATLFDERISDAIDYIYQAGRGITFHNLVGTQKSKGVEIEVNALVAKHVRLWNNYCYQDATSDIARDKYADWLVHAPHHKGQFGASLLFEKLDATLASYWNSKQRDYTWALVGQDPVPGYIAFFARANYHVTSKVALGVMVKNLFNSRYFDKNGQKIDAKGVPLPETRSETRSEYHPPRTILADLRLNF